MWCVFPFLSYGGGCGFHYAPVRQVSAVFEKIYMMMAEVTDNNGRSWAGVLVGGVAIGFGTYLFGGHRHTY